MSFEKIETPKLVGCLCCAGNIKSKLSKETWLDVGFGMIFFEVDGKVLWQEINSEWKLKDLEQNFKGEIEKGEVITLQFDRPLRDETYRLDKENGEWHLIKQGNGFA